MKNTLKITGIIGAILMINIPLAVKANNSANRPLCPSAEAINAEVNFTNLNLHEAGGLTCGGIFKESKFDTTNKWGFGYGSMDCRYKKDDAVYNSELLRKILITIPKGRPTATFENGHWVCDYSHYYEKDQGSTEGIDMEAHLIEDPSAISSK